MTDPDKGWQLPEVVDPPDFWCYQVYIPKDIAYLRAFRGALGTLAYNWNWQRDPAHTASLVVQKWIDQIDISEQLFSENEGECVDICAEILNCILTNGDIQNAISYYSNISNINSSTTENQSILDTNVIDNPFGCDNDIIYGMCVQIVEFTDRIIKDLFEVIDASQLSSVNVGYIIKLIPVLETFQLDEIFELTDKLVDDVETAYLSASTELLKTEIACELFCLAQLNNCTLSFETIRDYYQDKANVVFTYTDVLSFILDFTSGTFVGNASFYAMHILFYQILAFGGKFLEYLAPDYFKIIASMLNDPDPDWSIECDDCGWTHTFDFTVNDGGFVPMDSGFGDRGVWSSGNGWITTDVQIHPSEIGRYRRTCFIKRDFTETEITRIEMTYDYVEGNTVEPTYATILVGQYDVNTPLATITQNFNSVQDGDDQVQILSNTEDTNSIRLLTTTSSQNSAIYTGSATITKCKVYGTGDNPFD